MEFRRPSRRVDLCRGARAVILIVFCPTVVHAQQPATKNSVEELRKTLCARGDTQREQSEKTKAAIASLSGMRDLGRALILPEWRLADWDQEIVVSHRENHAELTKLFQRVVGIQLASVDPTIRREALGFLVELSSAAPTVFQFSGVGRRLTPALAEMVCHGSPPECNQAAHALAVVHPEPNASMAALGSALVDDVTPRRLAAAGALGILLRSKFVLATSARGDSRNAHLKELVEAASAVASVAGRGMDDAEVNVRLRCMEAVGQAASALHWLARVTSVSPADYQDANAHPATALESDDLATLARALKYQNVAIRLAMADSNAEVRLIAERALEDMAAARQTLMRTELARKGSEDSELRPASYTTERATSSDLLFEGIQKVMPAVTANLRHPDARVRRHAVDVLETLGPDARPAAQALVDATSDPDRFVRWAAARTLGKIAPVEARTAIPALEKLRNDVDADVRRAAAQTLQRYVTTSKK